MTRCEVILPNVVMKYDSWHNFGACFFTIRVYIISFVTVLTTESLARQITWDRSSMGEHCAGSAGVVGSNPIGSTSVLTAGDVQPDTTRLVGEHLTRWSVVQLAGVIFHLRK